MTAKIISIDEIDRRSQRPAAEAIAELRECLTDFEPCLEEFGKSYPGVIALAGFAAGEPFGVLVIAKCAGERHYRSLGARKAVGEWAVIIANLPLDLQEIFERELEKEKAIRLKADSRRRDQTGTAPTNN